MYENITYEMILQRMLDRVPDKLDKREGSVIWDTHSPTAIELQILYIELDAILREAYGDTASREFLILRCRERGIIPYPKTQAILKGKFMPIVIDVIGKRFSIGEINYKVTEKISDGEYRVQCETAGVIGNQYLGDMIPIEYIDRLASAELTEVLIPGEEEEETETLRKRYFASFDEKSFGGNRADYIEKTNAIPGVGKTKVTRIWNSDNPPADMIPSAAVKAWYESTIAALDGEAADWIRAVYSAALEKKLTIGGTVLLTILDSDFGVASETLIKTVQEMIDPMENTGEGYGLAPIGHIVSVKSAQGVEITVSAALDFETGYGWHNLQDHIDSAVSDYLLELRKTWDDKSYLTVRVSQIERRLLDIQGIVDVKDTLINGSGANLDLGPYEIPIFGGVTDEKGS